MLDNGFFKSPLDRRHLASHDSRPLAIGACRIQVGAMVSGQNSRDLERSDPGVPLIALVILPEAASAAANAAQAGNHFDAHEVLGMLVAQLTLNT